LKQSLEILNSNALRAGHAINCEFCLEFSSPNESRFHTIYKSITTRVITHDEGFIVMPTIGQQFRGSLLILPLEHVETAAELPKGMLSILEDTVSRLSERMHAFGLPVLFEHGAKCITGASCGIYHAHLHLVPVPARIRYAAVLPSEAHKANSISEALKYLRGKDNYLLFKDTANQVAFIEVNDNDQRFASQYFRRSLAQYFNLENNWDWRRYTDQEAWVYDTIKFFST
jgi:diadenosine tetraphosphate (Ap4A) HIT family hydrolase